MPCAGGAPESEWTQRGPLAEMPRPRGSKLRTVLVVDDEPILRGLTELALRSAGELDVLTASTGAEALEVARRERPDLVLLDVVMPEMDGPETLAQLRARPETASIPVIFMTGLPQRGDAEGLRACGAIGIIEKPFDPLTLAADIRRMAGEPEPGPTGGEGRAAVMAACDAAKPLLEVEVRELVTAFEAVRRTGDASAVRELRRRAHGLRGTAGSHGFPLLGVAAGRIDEALAQHDGAAPARRSAIYAQVERALGDARYAASQRARPISLPALNLVAARVLLVDPDPATLPAAVEIARRQLVQLDGARGPGEALALAAQGHFDAAILDVGPGSGEDPFSLVGALRSLPGNAQLPIAFTSSAPSVEQRVHAAHVGGALFLTKPVEPHELAAALQRLLTSKDVSQRRPRLLLVDDDPELLRPIASMLTAEGFVVSTSTDPTRTLEKLEECSPDLLVLDVAMAGLGGLDVCRVIRMTARWQGLPIFLLSEQTDLDSRLAGFAAGGTDFLAKPVVLPELLARVRSRLDFDRILRERADRDSLTQLLSRRALLEALSVRVSEARRHGIELAVCILDLDNFKSTNDTFGHLAGDRVLAGLGKLLAARFRLEDLRARWGGEEFVLVFPGVGAAGASAIVTRVLAEFREMEFEGERGHTFTSAFSAGVADLNDGTGDVEGLLRIADKRLYVAKRDGRCRVVDR